MPGQSLDLIGFGDPVPGNEDFVRGNSPLPAEGDGLEQGLPVEQIADQEGVFSFGQIRGVLSEAL
ncbi:MAG TPA: hypothetical protein VFX46_09140 [Hyphomicrobiaceae bacterium]|nr:hypothetical protein [Hyphomicrobiaceae bacterium]